MLQLDILQKELFDVVFAGRRWIYVPRTAGEETFGLAIVVVGQSGKIEISTTMCCSYDFEEIGRYAETLNTERETRWNTGEMPKIPEFV